MFELQLFYFAGRTDGKSSIKMYTDPDYFVQLWVESLQKNVSESSKKHDKQKVKRVSELTCTYSVQYNRVFKLCMHPISLFFSLPTLTNVGSSTHNRGIEWMTKEPEMLEKNC